jgi:hypothetical protein
MPIISANYSIGGAQNDPSAGAVPGKRKFYSIDTLIGGAWQTLFDIEDSDTGNPNVLDLHISGRVFARDSVLSAPGRFFFKATSTPFSTDAIMSVAYSNNIYIAGSQAGVISRSLDGGKTWSAAITNPFGGSSIWAIGFGNGVFVAITYDHKVARSTDYGVTWGSLISTNNFGVGKAVAYGNGVFIIAGSGGMIRSTDYGASWGSLITPGGMVTVQGLAYGNGVFVAAGSLGPRVWRSTDYGVTWSGLITNPNTGGDANTVSYGNGVFVIGETSGGLIRSIDFGQTWGALISNPFGSSNLYCSCFSSGIFVIASDDGKIARSLDLGTSWGVRYLDNSYVTILDQHVYALCADAIGHFVLVGQATFAGAITYTDYVEAGAGIVESGSNSNGSWIKFADGTMECYAATLIPASVWAAISTPANFININFVISLTVSTTGSAGKALTHPTYLRSVNSFGAWQDCGTDQIVEWKLIGRWK